MRLNERNKILPFVWCRRYFRTISLPGWISSPGTETKKISCTRKDSNRMLTVRLEAVCASVSAATTRCRSMGVPYLIKFKQVSSDHHQMSLTGGPQVWCPEREGYPTGQNRQMPVKHYLPATSSAGGKKREIVSTQEQGLIFCWRNFKGILRSTTAATLPNWDKKKWIYGCGSFDSVSHGICLIHHGKDVRKRNS